MVTIEDIIIPFIMPALTAVIVFAGQWHKRGSAVQISAHDIQQMKEQIETLEQKIDKMSDCINRMNTDTEVFRYRMKVLEKIVDDASNPDWRKNYRQPFRPKDSNGE